MPSRHQWKLLPRVLTKKEKIFFPIFSCIFLISSYILLNSLYSQKTVLKPSQGGSYIEGVVGQPRFINPILTSSDIDRDLTEILFSGLYKYNSQGEIVPSMAESYKVNDQGLLYEVSLRQDILWHDGEKFTADDVIFTIESIQNPNYKSPEMINWIGVKIKKISDFRIAFQLKDPYFPFPEHLTIKILPEHIFKDIAPENFALVSYNLQPIGSGPFKFEEIRYNQLGKVESISLSRNQDYFGKVSYLDKITFKFFETEQALIKMLKKNEVDGMITPNEKELKSVKTSSSSIYHILLPRYFAVFLNPEQNTIFKEKKVREAINMATDKTEILKRVIEENGRIVNSPILPEIYGFEKPANNVFDLQRAQELLNEAGFEKESGVLVARQIIEDFELSQYLEYGSEGKEVEQLQMCLAIFPDVYPDGTVSGYFGRKTEQAVTLFQEKYKEEILDPWDFDKGTGIVSKTTRAKLNEVCNSSTEESEQVKISLTTVDQELLLKTAEVLKEQWEKLGIEVEIKSFSFNELSRNFIQPREYEMLLFGEVLGIIPDPFPFWHSSRSQDLGLNLAIYKNEEADDFLEKARKAQTAEKAKENLENFQNIIVNDVPAIFLYNPDFLYLLPKKIHGVELNMVADASQRFIGIENWYIKTSRSFSF